MGMSYEAKRSQLTVKTFDRVSLDYKKTVHRIRDKSPDAYNFNCDSREEIYLKLLQESSSLDTKQVFHGAPAFFKKKIGLKENGFISKNTNRISVDSRATPSTFRLRTCTGCSSSTQLQQESGDAPCCYKRERVSATLSRKTSKREFKDDVEEKLVPVQSFHSERFMQPKKPEWKSVWNSKPSIPSLTHKTQHEDLGVAKFESNPQPHPKVTLKPKPKEISTIFVVNGNVVSLPGSGPEHFTNWFAIADLSDPVRRRSILKKLDFSGFSNREISLKLFEGKKFVIEGIKGGVSGRTVKHAFKLPEDIEVESLFLSRDNQGYLVIERKSNANINVTQMSV